MTLDKAIKHCEDVVKSNTVGVYDAIALGGIHFTQKEIDECNRCAEEHRQLAEWLKELKAYKDDGKECAFCEHLGEKQICGRCRIHNLFAPMATNTRVKKRFELKPVHEIDCPWK